MAGGAGQPAARRVPPQESGQVPPEAAIDSPDWYAPQTAAGMPVTGLARARFATGGQFQWKLEWGAGEAPTSWNVAAQGNSSSTVTSFGSIDLSQVRAALASFTPPADLAGPTFSALSTNPYKNEFTVRLTVTGQGIPTPGIDRRVFTSIADPTLRPGFPKRMGTGGEGPIRYADINGDNVQELIVPTEDGAIHALTSFRLDPSFPGGRSTPSREVSPGMAGKCARVRCCLGDSRTSRHAAP